MARSMLTTALTVLLALPTVACGTASDHFRRGAIATAVGGAIATSTTLVVGQSCADQGPLCPQGAASAFAVVGVIAAGLLTAAGGGVTMLVAYGEGEEHVWTAAADPGASPTERLRVVAAPRPR